MIKNFLKKRAFIIVLILIPFLVGIVATSAQEIIEYLDVEPRDNVQYIEGVLDKVLNLKPATFKLLETKSLPEEYGEVLDYGFLVEDVQEVFPEWIVKKEGDYKRVRYGLNIDVTLIAALQEFYAQLTAGTGDIFVNTVKSNMICLDDICITKNELKALLNGAGIAPVVPSTPDPEPTLDPTPDPEPTLDPTPDPEPTPDPTPTLDPTPDPEPTLDPTPDPEPTPEPDPTPTIDPTLDPEPTPEPDPTPTIDPTPDPNPEPETTTTE